MKEEEKKEIEERLELGCAHFSTKQRGYGRQALFCEGFYIQDIFPNIKEHFELISEEDSFWDDERECYTDSRGNEIDEDSIFVDLNEKLCSILKERVLEKLDEYEDGEDEDEDEDDD